VIGCECPVCTSSDPRDNRLRTAALVRTPDQVIAIDCGPDFRQQMLREGAQKLDAIVITHEHNDHIIGLDDIRPFNFMNWTDMPVYATDRTARELRRRFAYIFAENPYPGAPMVRIQHIDPGSPFKAAGLRMSPVRVMHGKMPVLGFRIGEIAYVTDIRSIEPEEKKKLKKLQVLILSALHHKSHHSHLNLEQALELIRELQPRQTYLTHISHRMGRYADINPTLPEGVDLGYDGLKIRLDSRRF